MLKGEWGGRERCRRKDRCVRERRKKGGEQYLGSIMDRSQFLVVAGVNCLQSEPWGYHSTIVLW